MIDVTVAEQFKTPDGKQRALAQFNKITGELTSVMMYVDPDTLNNDYFVYREIEYDFNSDVIVGTADDFVIKAQAEMPQLMTEPFLDAAARDKITKQYPVVQQVNVLGRAILKLSEAAGIEQAEMQEMLDYIDEVKKANQLRKEFYMASPDYEYQSYEDIEQQNARQLEGGIHELYGPRPTQGGSVF